MRRASSCSHGALRALLGGVALAATMSAGCLRGAAGVAARGHDAGEVDADEAVDGAGAAPPALPEEAAPPEGADPPERTAPRDQPPPEAPAPADAPPPADPPAAVPDSLANASFRAPVVAPSPSIATRTAVLAPGACWKELERRKLPFARSKQAASNVATPLRSTGPLNGVRIVIPRAPSPYGVLDCRLALILDDMTKVLAELDVVEIQIDNTHRPKAKLPRRGAGRSQHAYGLAADVTRLKRADGTQLRVADDWGAPIGAPPCGPEATIDPPTAEAIALRDVVCELARRGVFHHLLTPSFDRAHRDHFHLDIKRGEKRTLIR